ncbi:probable E3 ubiquitin-protein ligase HIP1 [Hibiscus syriacus]|uniref:probable E3 ubiquitin-protein ligase HIP1 n=1 Tax=Hibiscus syriacus TaxID=106335 RepID=UPI001921A482|nr:probable E3 ubiquitin-protein ligase HIP1 [Hibiscus syriacus]XP_039029155.1 probable E3 ubiquitin-protein ligase HIP1 [Hibiscus syriacus]
MLKTIESNYGDDDDQNNNDYGCFEVRGDIEFLEGQYINNVNEETEYDGGEEDNNNEIDSDNLSYEELIVLEEIIGAGKRGVSEEEFSSCLRPFKFQSI